MQTNESLAPFRFKWLDLIRALGAFLVVLAHVEYSGSGNNVITNFYFVLTRTAVPLFFMASGFLLLSKSESYSDFYKKRALKVFIPFLIWSVIYLVWQRESFDQSFLTILKTYFIKILRGPRANHLWFFYELFGLYLFTPILRLFVQKAETKDLLYFWGIWFLFTPLAGLLQEFTPVQIGVEYYFLNGYIGYFIFGYLAGRIQFTRPQKMAALAIFLVSLIVTLIGFYLFDLYHIKSQYLGSYLSVNIVLLSTSLFVVFTGLHVPDKFYPAVSLLSRTSFGVYLAHVLVMSEFFAIPFFSTFVYIGSAVFMIPLLGLLGYVLSLLLIVILQKIPVLKYIVP
jgi:surface polysaccharide O-acyltransferase-like enzyme